MAGSPMVAAQSPQPVARRINATALWASHNELLLGTNDVGSNNEVFAMSLDDPMNGEDVLRLRSIYPNSVNSIVVSPDGKWAAMDEIGSSGPSLVALAHADAGTPTALLAGPEDYASLAFLPGGKRLAMASGGEVYTVDLSRQAVVDTWRLSSNRFDVESWIHQDGSGPTLQVTGYDAPNAVYDLATRQRIAIPNFSKHPNAELYFRHRGRWHCFDQGKVIDLEPNRAVFHEPGGSAGVRMSPDGKTLVFRSPGGSEPDKRSFLIIDVETWKVRHRLKADSGAPSQHFGFLTSEVLADPSGIVQLWNVQTGQSLARINPWATTEYIVEGGLKASRRDWAIGLPDGRYWGSEAASSLLPNAKRRDEGVLRELRLALGLSE